MFKKSLDGLSFCVKPALDKFLFTGYTACAHPENRKENQSLIRGSSK
jgi:hypothetical protein